jgi:uncharacterized protein with NAD-binding domain and iron-sulfur cluster
MTINKKVIILGGGVGGLSAAHELIERNTSSHKFDIEIYEKDPNIPGGKARSLPVPNSGIGGRRNLPAEHGFRFFPDFYQHITDTMKRIPFRNDSVFHNLVDTSRLLIGRANHEPFVAISRFPQNLTDWEQAFEDYFKISETGLTKDDIQKLKNENSLSSHFEVSRLRVSLVLESLQYFGLIDILGNLTDKGILIRKTSNKDKNNIMKKIILEKELFQEIYHLHNELDNQKNPIKSIFELLLLSNPKLSHDEVKKRAKIVKNIMDWCLTN